MLNVSMANMYIIKEGLLRILSLLFSQTNPASLRVPSLLNPCLRARLSSAGRLPRMTVGPLSPTTLWRNVKPKKANSGTWCPLLSLVPPAVSPTSPRVLATTSESLPKTSMESVSLWRSHQWSSSRVHSVSPFISNFLVSVLKVSEMQSERFSDILSLFLRKTWHPTAALHHQFHQGQLCRLLEASNQRWWS